MDQWVTKALSNGGPKITEPHNKKYYQKKQLRRAGFQNRWSRTDYIFLASFQAKVKKWACRHKPQTMEYIEDFKLCERT